MTLNTSHVAGDPNHPSEHNALATQVNTNTASIALAETAAHAAATYETQAHASGTYETLTHASATYVHAAVAAAPTGVAATDTASIAAAIATGASLVSLLPGTYVVNLSDTPGFAGYKAAVQLPSGVTLAGAGEGLTTIKLASGQTTGSSAQIVQNTGLNGGDTNICIRDLTVDGNGAAYTPGTNYYDGISIWRARNCRIERVTVKNVFGNGPTPPNETFAIAITNSVDVTVTDCTVYSDAGTTGSGFADNSATSVHFVNCVARGITQNGFTSSTGANITYTGCHAYSCATGFNLESGSDVAYTACVGGGAASSAAGGVFYANSASLGNTNNGFICNAASRTSYIGCHARNNNVGLNVTGATLTDVAGGVYKDNTGANDITFNNQATAQSSNISTSTAIGGVALNGSVGWTDAGQIVPSLGVAASGTTTTNVYPWSVTIYITGGTVTGISVAGVATGMTGGAFTLRAGQQIAITYSAAPSWTWTRT